MTINTSACQKIFKTDGFWRVGVGLCIAVAVFCIYFQSWHYDYVSFDDAMYVFENPIVKKGLTCEGIRWAFGFHDITYWHPLTWISHMIDCEIFGLDAGGHHLAGLFIHFLNSLLLFVVLLKMTCNNSCSAFAAILFAVHPINVESVAWIAERKNVLSTFFWLLTMLAYTRFAGKPIWKTYLPVLVAYLMGLMAKPMLITLPLILLLLDFWPLGRTHIRYGHRRAIENPTGASFQKRSLTGLVGEKVPLMILSLGSVWLSVQSAVHHNIFISNDIVPMVLRIKNAVVSIAAYLGMLIWPVDLAVFYPYPEAIAWRPFIFALGLTLIISGFVLGYAFKYPFMVVGWMWYLVSLMPVVGLVQGGLWPALADRWAYVPFIGLYIIIAWGGETFRSRSKQRWWSPVLAFAIVVLMILTSRAQTAHWKNSTTLFNRAIAVTANNDVAHNNLGAAYYKEGRKELAIFHFAQALEILPGSEGARQNLRLAISDSGTPLHSGIERIIVLFPENPGLKYMLGNVYMEEGKLKKAAVQYKQALAIRPDFALALNNLGIVYSMAGKYEEALGYFKKKIELQPDAPGAYYYTACVYAKQNHIDLSVDWLKQSIERGFDNWNLLLEDANLENIRQTAYYRRLVHDKMQH